MVKNTASPDNLKLRAYWPNRQKKKNLMTNTKKQNLWKKQQGICPCCFDILDNGEQLHTHHIKPKSLGGGDKFDNLIILHAACHRQAHSKQDQAVDWDCLSRIWVTSTYGSEGSGSYSRLPDPAICSEIEQLIRQKSSHNTSVTFDSETITIEEEE